MYTLNIEFCRLYIVSKSFIHLFFNVQYHIKYVTFHSMYRIQGWTILLDCFCVELDFRLWDRPHWFLCNRKLLLKCLHCTYIHTYIHRKHSLVLLWNSVWCHLRDAWHCGFMCHHKSILVLYIIIMLNHMEILYSKKLFIQLWKVVWKVRCYSGIHPSTRFSPHPLLPT